MKKILSIFVFLLFMFPARSQVIVGETNINDPANEIHYVTVNLQNTRWWIYWGQDEKRRVYETKEIKDAEGNKPESINYIALFNFMRRNGWEYVERVEGDYMGVSSWLFKRIE